MPTKSGQIYSSNSKFRPYIPSPISHKQIILCITQKDIIMYDITFRKYLMTVDGARRCASLPTLYMERCIHKTCLHCSTLSAASHLRFYICPSIYKDSLDDYQMTVQYHPINKRIKTSNTVTNQRLLVCRLAYIAFQRVVR